MATGWSLDERTSLEFKSESQLAKLYETSMNQGMLRLPFFSDPLIKSLMSLLYLNINMMFRT